MSMRDYKVTYIWRGDLELEAESKEDAMEETMQQLVDCGGDPRAIFSCDDEEIEVEEA